MKLIGSGIFLLLVGLILAFAWEANIPDLDDDALGYVLIAVGLLSIILGLVLRRRPSNTNNQVKPPENPGARSY